MQKSMQTTNRCRMRIKHKAMMERGHSVTIRAKSSPYRHKNNRENIGHGVQLINFAFTSNPIPMYYSVIAFDIFIQADIT